MPRVQRNAGGASAQNATKDDLVNHNRPVPRRLNKVVALDCVGPPLALSCLDAIALCTCGASNRAHISFDFPASPQTGLES